MVAVNNGDTQRRSTGAYVGRVAGFGAWQLAVIRFAIFHFARDALRPLWEGATTSGVRNSRAGSGCRDGSSEFRGGGLEQLGCKLLDGRDALGMIHTTKQLQEGAIIYIDDFVGSGTQAGDGTGFHPAECSGRLFRISACPEYLRGRIEETHDLGVSVYTGHIQAKAERPLHEASHILPSEARHRQMEICSSIRPKGGLGYENMATMVVLYRNAPERTEQHASNPEGQRQERYFLWAFFRDFKTCPSSARNSHPTSTAEC